mgnify:CR=1 FL=1
MALAGPARGRLRFQRNHALEALQCWAERRRGGETGVRWIHALRGDAVWKALAAGNWAAGGFDRALFDACLARLDKGDYREAIRATWAAKHGLAWYEFDWTWVSLKLLNAFGLVWDLKVARITPSLEEGAA